MISSVYLYGELDRKTARLQKKLFTLKKAKAYKLLSTIKEDYNLLDFSDRQRQLEQRVVKIVKAIEFCNGQIEEAEEVLNEKP